MNLCNGMSMTSFTSFKNLDYTLFTRYLRRVLWLLQKHTNVVFIDEEEDPPDYLKIVDLEWNIEHIIVRDEQGSFR